MACESSSGKILLGKCCDGLITEFARDRVLEVYVDDFSNTAQQNSDFAEDYVDNYDMTTIPLQTIRRVTFSNINSEPTVTDLSAGNNYVSGAIGQLLFLSQPRVRVGRTICETGPLLSVCRYHYKPGTGDVFECTQNQPLPQDIKAVPDLTETFPARAEVRFSLYFPGFSLLTPSCCSPAP